MPPVIFVGAAAALDVGGIQFAIPSTAKVRDTAIAAVLESNASGPDPVTAAAAGWSSVASFPGATHSLHLFRREIAAGEASRVVLPFPLADPPLAILLVYRNLDAGAAIVGSSSAAVAASAAFPCPSRTMSRYSDLYLGIAAVTNGEVTIAAPTGATKRIELAGVGLSLLAFDLLPGATGATGVRTATASSAKSGIAASLAFAADALIGFGKSFTIDPHGAIGLPSRGV